MFCPECGAKTRDDALFCEVCGRKLAVDSSAEQTKSNDPTPVAEPVFNQPQYYADPVEMQCSRDASTAYGLGIASLIFLILPGFYITAFILSIIGMTKASSALTSRVPQPKARSGQIMSRITFWVHIALILLTLLGILLSIVFAVNLLNYFGVDDYVRDFIYSVI